MRHAWTECGACGITEGAKNAVVQELNESAIKVKVPEQWDSDMRLN